MKPVDPKSKPDRFPWYRIGCIRCGRKPFLYISCIFCQNTLITPVPFTEVEKDGELSEEIQGWRAK